MTNPTAYVLEVNPKMPRRLLRLEELANNLWYSWDRSTRALFARLHPQLWDATGHSPKALLKRIDEERLVDASDDPVFLSAFNRVLSAYDTYHSEPLRRNGSEWLRQTDLVAYFCAEFGFHESLPIYSGGLGILAGDHCKAASDMRLPFVGVGLLYRQGYFSQSVDAEGNQHPLYSDSDFEDLPISPVLRESGEELHVQVELAERKVEVKVWQARVGHVTIYLLDTDLESNGEHDRYIAHRLYGGDKTTRIEQEIILGVGGVRALAEIGLKPTVWHINEGHAAFLILERVRSLMGQGLDFHSALEAVAVNLVFTTHTAVPAGHDHFAEEKITSYFDTYCRQMDIDGEQLLSLGRVEAREDFNMTALAIRGSRHHNGVSRIHGSLTSDMLRGLWPQLPAEENPVDYITNGVHVPTFLAPEWVDIFDRFLGFDWASRLHDSSMWERLTAMPDHIFWSTRQHLKAQMLHLVRHRVRIQHLRNQGSESHLDRLLRLVNPDEPDVLTIGFGRRFATYKRATLLFENLDLLREIISDAKRPVLFIFAGKAHPADVPGQDLIRAITRVSRMPEFEGHVLLVEGYDLRLARRLVSGCDVWLNNPVYPLEASGTSGMKAGLNGTLNLSVADGWWGEGYDGKNGWTIKPASSTLDEQRRDWEEAQTLYEILQDRVLPLYYGNRSTSGFSHEWVTMSKHSIATLLPQYSATRMVNEYVAKFYLPASQMGRRYTENGFEKAKDVAQWKRKVRAAWPGLRLRRLDSSPRRIRYGQSILVEAAVQLHGLSPADVMVELMLSRGVKDMEQKRRYAFSADGTLTPEGEHRFVLELEPEICGRLDYRIRCYPAHDLLTHPFELGLMAWT
ncbi:MAG TPA: alpha-glucan family phosphorylase [Burkholderiales bacterium]|nr:alpha-glucan family phosphorylase [Burkholderiales bacterium]